MTTLSPTPSPTTSSTDCYYPTLNIPPNSWTHKESTTHPGSQGFRNLKLGVGVDDTDLADKSRLYITGGGPPPLL
eukprot:189916-Hanusia_phi.AAC.1